MLRGQHRLGNGLLCLGPADADVACRRGDPVSRAGFAGHCRRDQTPVSRALSKVAPHRFQCVTTGRLLMVGTWLAMKVADRVFSEWVPKSNPQQRPISFRAEAPD